MNKNFLETIIKPHLNTIPDLELLAKQIVEGFIIGWHKSPYHGFSVEFAEHRIYNPGDSLKHVDWKVYGRNDKMFTKKYEEETNLRCYITIDQSASMTYKGQNTISKIQSAVLYTSALIELLTQQMDACGLVTFDEQVNIITKAQSNTQHKRNLYAQLETLWHIKADNVAPKKTHIAPSIHEIAERIHQRSLVVLFTDMMDSLKDTDALIDAFHHLKHNKHEIIVFLIGDKKTEWEFELPDQAVELVDLETMEVVKLHPKEYRESYINKMSELRKNWKERMQELNIDYYEIDIMEHPEQVLRNYLTKRMKMM